MPTKLPSRRRVRRRPLLSVETRENIAATAAEFMLALVFASVVVLAIAHADHIGLGLSGLGADAWLATP